jgi:hypothetical protein
MPRWAGLALVAGIAVVFASNHVAARLAFDHGTSVTTAVAVRSAATALAVWALLRATGTFAAHQAVVDRVMDSNDQERERGITSLAKAASIVWKGVKINVVDTPVPQPRGCTPTHANARGAPTPRYVVEARYVVR